MKGALVGLLFSVVAVSAVAGQAPSGRGAQSPGPSVTVNGQTWTQQSLFQRNVGGPDDMTTAFPPHKVIGNIYYVGTKSLAVFLVVTPAGNILINSTYERNVPIIRQSIEKLGFKFADTKILLGSHAHGHSVFADGASQDNAWKVRLDIRGSRRRRRATAAC